MSKGSSPRPFSVSQQEYGNNFDRIFRKSNKREIEDAQLEDEAFDKIEDTIYNRDEGKLEGR